MERALHAGKLSLQTRTQNLHYLLLLYGNKRNAKAPQRYVVRTLPVFNILCSLSISRQKPG